MAANVLEAQRRTVEDLLAGFAPQWRYYTAEEIPSSFSSRWPRRTTP
jgi:hypothetical protein